MGKGKIYHLHKHEHFKMIHKDYGHGARSKVSIIKREPDGKLFIWKQPLLDDDWHHESLQKEINYAKYWRKFGVSKIEICWHPDRRSLLKTYIEGDTLEHMLKNGNLNFSTESRPLKALRKFFGLLIGSKHYISDLISENLVFDGNMWHIIDSGSIRKEKSRSDTKQNYKRRFLENWSKAISSENEIHMLESFLDSVKPLKHRNH